MRPSEKKVIIQGVPKKMGINNLVWLNYDLVLLIMIVMIFCSCHYFSTHTCDSTSHRAALTTENLPSWIDKFCVVIVCLLTYKSHLFYTIYDNEIWTWLAQKYLNIFSVVKVSVVKCLPCLKFLSNSAQPLKKLLLLKLEFKVIFLQPVSL